MNTWNTIKKKIFNYQIDPFTNADKKNKTQKNKNAGMNFMKYIIKYCTNQSIKVVILITDFITSHAIKHMNKVKTIDITHFTYAETCVENISTHIYQPTMFKVLSSVERKSYISKNPMYKTELFHYSVDDALVKYYGLKVGDIVYIEYSDRQTGIMSEYRLIVDNL